MKTSLIAYVSSFLPLLMLDGTWLYLAKNFYTARIGHLMGSPQLAPILLFYPLYALGLTLFVVLPALQGQQSFIKIFVLGALFGLVAYGTYDLTNQATLRDWPALITTVDLAWGASLSGIVATVAVLVTRYIS